MNNKKILAPHHFPMLLTSVLIFGMDVTPQIWGTNPYHAFYVSFQDAAIGSRRQIHLRHRRPYRGLTFILQPTNRYYLIPHHTLYWQEVPSQVVKLPPPKSLYAIMKLWLSLN
jgi:hypothetical protein